MPADATRGFVHKEKIIKEVENPDDPMRSRYDQIHGDKGLCHLLVELFNERCSTQPLFGTQSYFSPLYLGLDSGSLSQTPQAPLSMVT